MQPSANRPLFFRQSPFWTGVCHSSHLLDNLHFDHFVKINLVEMDAFDEMVEMEIVQQMGRSGTRLILDKSPKVSTWIGG